MMDAKFLLKLLWWLWLIHRSMFVLYIAMVTVLKYVYILVKSAGLYTCMHVLLTR